MAAVDLTGNGLLALIMPSAWVDHHNAGEPRPLHVYLQTRPRVFEDAGARFAIPGVAAVAVACAGLDGDGELELVVANYRAGFEYETDSFIYRRRGSGFDVETPLRLPTHYAMQVELADLDGDGRKELIFAGGDQVRIYWNRGDRFSSAQHTVLQVEGSWSQFTQGAVRVATADVDGDGRDELLTVSREGVQIRSATALHQVRQTLPLDHGSWLHVADLDGDGRPDLIVSRREDGRSYETESMVFWNGPDGFSPQHVTTLATTGAMGCTAVDLDGDGRPELVFNNTMAGPSQNDPEFSVYVYLGGPGGSFDPTRRLELPTGGSNTYVLADLDQDGHADLVCTARDGLRVFHGGPDGLRPDRFTDLRAPGQSIHHVQVGDFDRDGWLDLLAVAFTDDDSPTTMAASSVIFHGSAQGFASERSTVLPTYTMGNARVADLTGNGWLDVVCYDPRGYLCLYHGGPAGFSPQRMSRIPLDIGGPGNVAAINCADLTGNGYLDLIVVVMGHYTRMQSGFHILYGGPEGYSQERRRIPPHRCLQHPADSERREPRRTPGPAGAGLFDAVQPRAAGAHLLGHGGGYRLRPPHGDPLRVELRVPGGGHDRQRLPRRARRVPPHRPRPSGGLPAVLQRTRRAGLGAPDAPARHGPPSEHAAGLGNAFTREPCERYRSPAYELAGREPMRVAWSERTPPRTAVELQLRWAGSRKELARAPWQGAAGAGSTFPAPGEVVGFRGPQRWLQYQATLISRDGCNTPSLRAVTVEFA